MAEKKLGSQTIRFANPPRICGAASVVGKKEGEGPLRHTFDTVNTDTTFGNSTWEKAESFMQQEALSKATEKSGLATGAIDMVIAGDLINQCICTTFGMRKFERPFVGIYGACSNMAEALLLGSMAIDGGFADTVAGVTSSHFCSAERQYRFPLEYGGQRTPSAQWTVTGAGAVILSAQQGDVAVTHAATGIMADAGIQDVSQMGAAMAPAAYGTISQFWQDTATKPGDYDLIITGDLGVVGLTLLRELFKRDGVSVGERLTDCGVLIFDMDKQNVPAGASGCGCSAVVLCGHLLEGLRTRRWKKILFAGTGALLSPISSAQGESIPGICHLVQLETV